MSYTDEELQQIRSGLLSLRQISQDDAVRIRTIFSERQYPPTLLPFAYLLQANPELFEKLSRDELVQRFSSLAFFPETYPLFYEHDVVPVLESRLGNRGTTVIVKHPIKTVVIKPYQSNREPVIARIAAEEGVGPQQFGSLDGYITEAYVDGVPFCRLKADAPVYEIGRRIGEIFTKLHRRGVYYNDTTLDNDMGGSHIIVPAQGQAMLIDFGVALQTGNHHAWGDEEVIDFLRTMPLFGATVGYVGALSAKDIKGFADAGRRDLETMTRDNVLDRDIQFIQEGLSIIAMRLGGRFANQVMAGFESSYKREPYAGFRLGRMNGQE
ncbi:hypothetical protein HYS47_01330 [Candidatus Woesearchaeota archaeon]|nr:hypothetical protein [Candidatus Woesearchaeota archaeon]